MGERVPVQRFHRSVRIRLRLKQHRAKAPRPPVRSERDVRADDGADLAEQVLEVLPLALERELVLRGEREDKKSAGTVPTEKAAENKHALTLPTNKLLPAECIPILEPDREIELAFK